ncbi:MAG: hypothetical protein ACE5FM_00020 [Methyloligellaceae bacterium]
MSDRFGIREHLEKIKQAKVAKLEAVMARMFLCPCGSGKPSWAASDGQGSYVGRMCEDCAGEYVSSLSTGPSKRRRGERRLARDLGATETGSARDILEAAIEGEDAT